MKLIERLRELEAVATPVPWEVESRNMVRTDLTKLHKGYGISAKPSDCQLIAEMRNALPKLLAVVEAADIIRKNRLMGFFETLPALERAFEALEEP
jgi:hypothetical protein